MEAFLIGEIRLTGTRVAFSQTCSTGVHPPGKDRENLNQRGPESWGWSGMIAEMFNPGKACSIGLSRRAPWRTGEPGGSQCTKAEEAATMAINVQGLQGHWNQLKGDVKK